MKLDETAKEFRDRMRDAAEKKRKAKRPAIKAPVIKKVEDVSTLALLTEIRDLLKQGGHGVAAGAKFEVTERDANGKIKAFKVG